MWNSFVNIGGSLGIENVLLLVVGFYLLIKGAEVLIEGASALASRVGLSPLVIALTVVAFGTSAPELGVNLTAAFSGSPELAVSNIIGSNIANLALVLGIAGFAGHITVKSRTVWKEIPMLIVISLLLLILASDNSLGGGWSPGFDLADGLTLILFFCFFLGYIINSAVDDINHVKTQGMIKAMSLGKSILLIIGGIAGLTIGARWIVESSHVIATNFGISERVIGLTLLAVGTSLPELATSVVAAIKNESDIAIGNLVGSNIFNVGWVLAVTILVKPMTVPRETIDDMYWMIGTSVLLFAFLLMSKHKLKRWQCLLFLLFYIGFINFIIINR